MAALGALVAGIAHELNTPIGNSLLTATALSDLAAQFERKLVDGGTRRSVLDAYLGDTRLACSIMAGSLGHAADLIISFKQVAVDQASDQRRKFDLCAVLRDTMTAYAVQLRRARCEVHLELPGVILCDSYPGSLGPVLNNLINNALLHAFDGRATARITLRVRELDAGTVQLAFSDDGAGMGAKTMRQIFEPYFTTRMGQGGSGLGMTIVHNIVTSILGGRIDIASLPGQGATITLTLPKAAPARAPEADALLAG